MLTYFYVLDSEGTAKDARGKVGKEQCNIAAQKFAQFCHHHLDHVTHHLDHVTHHDDHVTHHDDHGEGTAKDARGKVGNERCNIAAQKFAQFCHHHHVSQSKLGNLVSGHM